MQQVQAIPTINRNSHDIHKSDLYLKNYGLYFNHLKYTPINLLELGIFTGGSLKVWRDYFEYGKIVGVDIFKVNVPDSSGRIRTYQGLQQDKALLAKIAAENAPEGFDIIIDDASHIGELTKKSFWYLFNHHLKPGGIYVIEDWRTGYYKKFIDGRKFKQVGQGNSPRTILQSALDRYLNNIQDKPLLTKIVYKIRKLTTKKTFSSHNYGMVGFVKQLVDELGMDIITGPEGGGTAQHNQNCKFLSMNIYPGQVFIFKNYTSELSGEYINS